MVHFSFCGLDLLALPEGAAFYPATRTLLVADLHLEKGSAYAKRGQMLPPYDSIETLRRIEALIARTEARTLVCLGDSFHDPGGVARLEGDARDALVRMGAAVDWVWIVGNHDAEIVDPPAGRVLAEAMLGDAILRHAADPRDPRPEISGHYHPKYIVTLRGRRVSRPCFVVGRSKLILPSFGAYTGVMDAGDPAILRAVGRDARALVPAGERLLDFPLAA